MKIRQLFYVAIAAMLALPLTAGAEIYKWKDKEGVVRYSDTPPPSNIKQESIGKKKIVIPSEGVPAGNLDKKITPGSAASSKATSAKEVLDSEAEAAKIRQHNAEVEKKNKLENEKQAKAKEENCRVARGNMGNYQQGGRLYKTDENGNRQYITDAELQEAKAKAQREIEENCIN